MSATAPPAGALSAQGQQLVSEPLTDMACQPQAHVAASRGAQLDCPTCGRPRCVASAKSRPGERCRRNPHPGARICSHHGLTQAGRVAAAESRAAASADGALADLWPGLAGAEPVTDPVGLLQRTAGVLEQMADTLGERVNNLEALAGGDHKTQLRAEVLLLDRLLDKVLKAAEGLARLGLAERQIELAAGQAELVVGAARAMLSELDLLPVDRDRALRAFLGGLGRGPVVAGELVKGPTP